MLRDEGVLTVMFTHKKVEAWDTLATSLMEAGPTRLRPILMTNVAIAIALAPQAIGSGAGSFYRIPMAVVTIGGVLVAAVFGKKRERDD